MESKVSEVYDFCLAWQMQGECRDVEMLSEHFKEMQIPFLDFKALATSNKWYVKSMDVLEKY